MCARVCMVMAKTKSLVQFPSFLVDMCMGTVRAKVGDREGKKPNWEVGLGSNS